LRGWGGPTSHQTGITSGNTVTWLGSGPPKVRSAWKLPCTVTSNFRYQFHRSGPASAALRKRNPNVSHTVYIGNVFRSIQYLYLGSCCFRCFLLCTVVVLAPLSDLGCASLLLLPIHHYSSSCLEAELGFAVFLLLTNSPLVQSDSNL
jgi:hypothetical protein